MSVVAFFHPGSHGILWSVVPESYHSKGKPIPRDSGASLGIILVSNHIERNVMFPLGFYRDFSF